MLIAEVLVESENLLIPGLSKLIGKKVEVQIVETESASEREARMQSFFDIAGTIELDADAIDDLRSESLI